MLDRPEPVCVPETGTDLPAFRREQARRRCTTLLRCLCGVAISTGLIGLFPRLHLAWVVTGLSGVAALGLVGLMAYAKEIEAERQRRTARQLADHAGPTNPVDPFEPATAGYPGAWDDEDEVPRAAAR